MKFRITLLTFLMSFSAHGYEIGKKAISGLENPNFSTDKVIHLEWEKNHEKLTALSLQCIADTNEGHDGVPVMPVHCNRNTIDASTMSLFNGSSNYPVLLDKYRPLIRTVRWPDDPTRQVYEDSETSLKFAGTMKITCKDRMKKSNTGEIDIVSDGLLCAGHYGKLQFLHSMAYSDDVSGEDTLNKIKSWSKFAYLFSLSEINHDQKYCEFWSNNNEYSEIEDAFGVTSVDSRGWCEERPISFWNRLTNYKLWFSDQKTYPAWNVATTFSHSCDRAVGSGDCTIIEDKSEVSLSALGSIIHLIQDSYSKSHTFRGNSDNDSEIMCSDVINFLSYTNQDVDKHSKADKWPVFNESCSSGNSGTLDPITASAQIIWLHLEGNTDTSKVEEILTKVYGKLSSNSTSSAGKYR